ncbi:MAG TPA: urate hydroxylase PuuD [Allosphingosinicella sp.]|nr:urate hydroxylase PuuD [Allosphingosinicella sp.]
MGFDTAEWLNLAIRWLHLTAGIAWIGSSFYFVWLDNHLTKPAEGHASGELWSVHGGGFYHNQKYQVAPSTMPDRLHWFKWEAYFTWISGFSLLVLVYYVGAQSFLIDPAKAPLSPPVAIGIGLVAIVLGWLVYDGMCRSPVASSNPALGGFWFAFLLLAAIMLDSLFSSRAAYLHIGAIIGTVMVANVFLIIIPNQRKVVADLIAGRTPDPRLGAAAKQRSLHNNYMTLPVLFIMISPHYPMTYGAERPWLVLALLGLTGVAVRHIFNLRGRGKAMGATIAAAAALALATVTYVTLEKKGAAPGQAGRLTFAEIEPILAAHCAGCHNVKPPPAGVALDSWERARAASARIKAVAVDSHVMPLGNPTGMTPAERQKLGAWIAAGSPR